MERFIEANAFEAALLHESCRHCTHLVDGECTDSEDEWCPDVAIPVVRTLEVLDEQDDIELIEVITCGECKHWRTCCRSCCKSEDSFCSDGERAESGEERS